MSAQYWQVMFVVLVTSSLGILCGWKIGKIDQRKTMEPEVKHLRATIEQLRRELVAARRWRKWEDNVRPNPLSPSPREGKRGGVGRRK